MKVTGFTFIKNAIKFDFPIKEAILSILPLCDEIVVAVGDCTDGTRELVATIHPTKIRIIDTIWDAAKNTGGIVLADETNKAMASISTDTDWCFYIQGDEVFHERDIETVKQAMMMYKDDINIDGLLFKYLHFYGSYDYVGSSNKWYRNEIRVIKNNKNIYSYKDAQGFRKGNNKKLLVKAIDAFIHHYGWVKEPKVMEAKLINGNNFWGGNKHKIEIDKINFNKNFDYNSIDSLEKFTKTHPRVIQEKISKINWLFSYDLTYNHLSLKHKIKKYLQKLTGIYDLFEYKNYKSVY